MTDFKVNIVFEYDDDYGLPGANHLHYSDVPLGHSVEDIYGTRWIRRSVGFIELTRGRAHRPFDDEAAALLCRRHPSTAWD